MMFCLFEVVVKPHSLAALDQATMEPPKLNLLTECGIAGRASRAKNALTPNRHGYRLEIPGGVVGVFKSRQAGN
jgi:hypothetical protein